MSEKLVMRTKSYHICDEKQCFDDTRPVATSKNTMVLVHTLKIDFKLYTMGQNFEIFVINSSKTQNRHTIWKITNFGKFYLQTSVDH